MRHGQRVLKHSQTEFRTLLPWYHPHKEISAVLPVNPVSDIVNIGSTKPPTYYVFFKGQDTEMMNLAFKKYLGVQMNKKDKPSIMEKLMHFKDAVSKGKNRERAREQQKDRGQSL